MAHGFKSPVALVRRSKYVFVSLLNHKNLCCLWMSTYILNYTDYFLGNEDISILKIHREHFKQNLQVKSNCRLNKLKRKIFLYNERHARLTASIYTNFVSLKSDGAKMDFLNRHLWKTDSINAPASQYIIKYENHSRTLLLELEKKKILIRLITV